MTLGSHSQILDNLVISSLNRLKYLEVVSFYETKKIPELSELVRSFLKKGYLQTAPNLQMNLDVTNKQTTPLYANHRMNVRCLSDLFHFSQTHVLSLT